MTIWAGKQMSLWDVLLAQADGLLPAHGQGHRPKALGRKGRRHHPAEGVGGVGHQDHAVFLVLPGELDRVGVGQLVDRMGGCHGPGGWAAVSTKDRTRMRREPWASLSSSLRIRGLLPEISCNHAGDLIGEVGVMAAAKADDLHILQALILGGQHRRCKHPGRGSC